MNEMNMFFSFTFFITIASLLHFHSHCVFISFFKNSFKLQDISHRITSKKENNYGYG
jgi:hypothetical protein